MEQYLCWALDGLSKTQFHRNLTWLQHLKHPNGLKVDPLPGICGLFPLNLQGRVCISLKGPIRFCGAHRDGMELFSAFARFCKQSMRETDCSRNH